MKKFYSLILIAAAAGLSASAQQLPSYGFEDTWVNCVPWNSIHLNKNQGTQPSGWCVSNVTSSNSTACQTVASQVTGNGSSKAVQVKNKKILSQIIPGYFTLGTTWSTAKASGLGTVANGTADGGTWGGLQFGYRPDALMFDYKRPTSSGQPATVIIYSWKGETQQADVPAENVYKFSGPSNPTKEAIMYNRDRTIINEMTTSNLGGNVTKSSDFEMISKTIHKITTSVSSWTTATIDIDYVTASTPTMFNIIFSAGDYLADRSTLQGDDELDVDNVKVLYYSRLASLTVNGATPEGFNSDTYSYTIDTELPSADAFDFICMGTSGSGKATLTLDEANATATIIVTNSNVGGTDVDGQTSHTYTLQFNKPVTPDKEEVALDDKAFGVYAGEITILAKDAGLNDKDIIRSGNVTISDNGKGNGTCTFLLPDFALSDEADGYIGDIMVDDVNIKKYTDGTYSLNGVINPLKLKMGDDDIVAKVTVNGTIDTNGVADMQIAVIWLMDPENDPEGEESGFPINVLFNGKRKIIYGGDIYSGNVTVLAKDAGLNDNDIVREGEVHIIADENDATKCTFVLPDFALSDEADGYIGDIVVPGLTVNSEGGSKHYTGSINPLNLEMNGEPIVAKVTVDGTVDASGVASMSISVIWLMDPENDPEGEEMGFPINVLFNGTLETAGIDEITIDNSNAPVEYYNLNGIKLNGDNLAPGIYIRRQGTEVTKILVR
ncbi:MAG: calycin-like domain-containing protein [Bacteroides sp.]|nr:calycin-like domain-containing protein [Bacteroides sp.]MCM1413329.1 calycin-like domain-containing protein [Bacteroides sp.]MCM1471985.1 calycin-like domain-containing protein [Bacteroides sp.]